MNKAHFQLLKEGLQLADDALGKLMEIDNENVKHIANLLHAAIVFGELLLGVSK